MKTMTNLAEEWEAIARNKFRSAEHEEQEIHRRFIEHGAVCYFNCATQLRDLIKTGDAALDLKLDVLNKNSECP